jgi:glycosyltransferase involved in cell wall biosynthesis
MKVSIITINKNNLTGLNRTIESVLQQTWLDKEYIIIDGGSTDGSVELIKLNHNQISYWISEVDTGIYNAMNKGIAKATGQYLVFMNSGDYFANSNVINNVLGHGSYVDILYGNYTIEQTGISYQSPAILSFSNFWYRSICHQCAFISKHLFSRYGFYDESLKVAADWKFFVITIFLNRATTHWVNTEVAIINSDGYSSQPEVYPVTTAERSQVYQLYFPGFIKDYEYYQSLDAKYNIWIYKLASWVHKKYLNSKRKLRRFI